MENNIKLEYTSNNKYNYPETFNGKYVSLRKIYDLSKITLEEALHSFSEEIIRIEAFQKSRQQTNG